MKKKAIQVILFNCVLLAALGQSVKTDLEQLNKKYMTLSKCVYSCRYNLYARNNPAPVETYFSIYKKDGDKYYTKTREDEYIVNKQFIMYVDHEAKEVLLQENTTKKEGGIFRLMSDPANLGKYLDTLLTLYKRVDPIPQTAPGSRAYRFECKNGPYRTVDMTIDTRQWVLKELVLYYQDKEEIKGEPQDIRIKISFESYNTNPVFADEFSELRYLSKANGKYKLKSAFSNYTLYDQTNLQ